MLLSVTENILKIIQKIMIYIFLIILIVLFTIIGTEVFKFTKKLNNTADVVSKTTITLPNIVENASDKLNNKKLYETFQHIVNIIKDINNCKTIEKASTLLESVTKLSNEITPLISSLSNNFPEAAEILSNLKTTLSNLSDNKTDLQETLKNLKEITGLLANRIKSESLFSILKHDPTKMAAKAETQTKKETKKKEKEAQKETKKKEKEVKKAEAEAQNKKTGNLVNSHNNLFAYK